MSDADHDAHQSDEGECLEKFRRIEPYVWFGGTVLLVLIAILLVVVESTHRINP